MKQAEFEAKVLELWTRTKVPLTRANLLAYTKVSRADLDRKIDEMLRAQLVELDSDDDGELLWTVRGAKRPSSGLETIGDLERKEQLTSQVEKLGSSAKLALSAAGLGKGGASGPNKKSWLASGALSFFFGPIGWLYAAPLKEALPAIAVYVLLCSILPQFLLVWILGFLNPVTAIAGVLYAWSYNHEGYRAPLLGKAKRALPMRTR